MKNLTQLPGSGKGSKAKNDNTLGRMHGGIRSRIDSMSLKNTSLFGVILALLLTFGVGEMWANGGIGYKGVKFTKNSTATGWYNIHNVSWDYSNASYECRSGQSGVTDFNNANLGTVTTLKLKMFVVIGWTDNSDYVAGRLQYRLYKQGASAPSYTNLNVGNYGSTSNNSSAADVLVTSGNNRVVGKNSLSTDIVTSSTPAGNYYLQLKGLGRMQWSNGSNHGDFNANDGSEVKATLLVPGFATTSTSQAFGSVVVGGNSSTTTSFTQHYGTALTTNNCALSGTNSGDFSVTSISETGVTIKFAPSSAGSKSATLTITDANSKTCTITLTGTGTEPVGLTVVAGTGISSVTGSDEDISAGDNIAITATVATGYTWSTWTKTGTGTLSTFTAGTKNQTVTIGTAGNITLTASATENLTTVTVNVSPTGTGTLTLDASTFTPGNTTTAGVTTSRTVVATAANDYTFGSWSVTGNATGTNTTNTYTLKGNGSGGTGTLTANMTLIPVKLLYGSSTPLNSPTTGSALSYDATEHAYYIDVTTNSSPFYFRFDYNSNSEQYAGNWATYPNVVEATANGSKVDCNQTVKGWDNKSSIKYTGPNGSSIRIWFDYQNKKAWITETTYTVTINNGDHGTVSPNGDQEVGGSGTEITATPEVGYRLSSWGKTGSVTLSSTTTNPTTVSATGTGTVTPSYVRSYAYIQGRFTVTNAARNSETHTGSSAADWNASSTNIAMDYDGTNHRFYLHTYKTPAQLKAQQSGYDQWFHIKTSTSNNSLANAITFQPASNQDLATAGTKTTVSASATDKNIKFNSSTTDGYAILYFDEAGVWYELEHTLKYDANGGSGDAPAAETYYNHGVNATAASNTFTNSGYHFNGWKTAPSSGTSYAASANVPMNSNTTLYAQWEADTYTITLDKQSSATGHGSDGTAANPTATYNAVLPAISGTMPSGTGTYGFMGFYTAENGTGSRLTDGSGVWIASVDGYTDADKKWIHDDDVTLYAYYKQAEVTRIDFVAAVVETNATVTATPTIEPIPAVDYVVCWRVLYPNDNPLASQPTFTPGVGNSVSFTAPDRSGSYKLEATLRTGTSCGSGDVLNIKKETFQVASEHDVTVLYKCGDMTIKASEVLEGIKPLEWSEAITAPTITGYTFHHWAAGDGVTLSKNGSDAHAYDTAQVATVYIKATYDGTLTAVYTRKRMIYFYNTLNWESVYVYFYKNSSYWESTGDNRGSGANPTYEWTNTPYSEELHGEMQPIAEGSSIYYFDAEAEGVSSSYATVVFTEADQNGYGYFWGTKAVKRDDYASTSLPMFVPLADQTPETHNTTQYYFNGYWMNYPENTGYSLKIYDSSGASTPSRTIRFPYSAELMMPLKLEVDLNDPARDYYYTIYREDGAVLSANYDMNQNYHSDVRLNDATKKIKITTTASGIYTFTLVYMDNEGTKDYYISVDYPIGANDYRVWYSDTIAWSGAKHTSGWYHTSDVIRKNADAEVTRYDTVSFYIATGAKITPSMKFQYASAIAESGSVTWTDVDGGGISMSSYSSVITESGVYNFIIKQEGTATPVVEKVEPYTGNYYIRTDCAGNTKWDSYTTTDHLMTYSDYAETNSGYSHYYAHWVTNGSNVKFCIANDYSSSITDTLTQDYGTTIANINTGGYLASGDENNANIRFMWNQSTNKLSRAYIAGSGDISKRFLVLEGDEKMYDENGHSLTGEHQDHDKYGNYLGTDDQVVLHDDENFVYERTIQLNTKARAKLTAKYNSNVQYFIGSSSETIELLGGDEEDVNKYSMRIVYDFKTNRLVTAYIPNGDITTDLAIHADIMLVREHQEAGQQLIFKNDGSLSDVKTVYGVLGLNRWTLNNKEKTGSHSLLGDPKSVYERSFYWISFPFDVNLSDVFGFGTYGTHWAIEEYDGAARAEKGYWKDSEGFWNIIENRSNYVLKAGTGYVLAIDLALMKDNNTDFWSNNIEQVELFFPSASEVENIEATDTEITVPSHECTIDRRTDKTIPDTDNDRTTVDSHWNLIGVPSYANYGSTLKDGSGNAITWHDPSAEGLPYLYEWNSLDDSYTPQSVTTYPFKTMHSYMVQYTGKIKWSLASATPSVPARRVLAETEQNAEFRLEIQQSNKMTDQTFVRLSNDEQISTEFAFDEDMTKEFNKGKANVYTIISGYLPAAGNTLPMSEQTTVVPVGVKIVANDDYTFSIPEGTEGVGVTLIDNETGIRTSLSAVDYTVSLEAGTYNSRFVLEISPIYNTPTEIEGVESQKSKVESRKLLIDGLLYIVRDGKVYDARGARVE